MELTFAATLRRQRCEAASREADGGGSRKTVRAYRLLLWLEAARDDERYAAALCQRGPRRATLVGACHDDDVKKGEAESTSEAARFGYELAMGSWCLPPVTPLA